MAEFDAFGSAEQPATTDSAVSEGSGDPYAVFGGGAGGASGGVSMNDYEVDNSALRAWEQQHEVQLSDLANKSASKKMEMQEAGRNAVEKFYSDRRSMLDSRRTTHRSEQKDFISNRDAPAQGILVRARGEPD
eukprot:EC721796.1.p1 GENE.EC721796.1~~EC721796.1.p1  ORF type:complete len:145 (+),score=28.74 EC721796.1:37-435(+)